MTLLGPQIHYMPDKSHVIVLFMVKVRFIYLFIDKRRRKEQASGSPSEIMDLDVRSAFFFKSQFFVIKDLTVDALKNAFGELNLYLKKK